MQVLIATKGHTYGAKFRKPGDVYEALDRDAKLMVLLKNAKFHSEEPEPVSVQVAEPRPKRPYTRRNYTTKVLTAE